MKKEIDNKLEVFLKEIKSSKSISTVTNSRSDVNEIQDIQPSGSKTNMPMGVHASNNEDLDSKNDDFPFRASKMKDLKHPAKPLYRNEADVDVTILSNEESHEEDYHTLCTASELMCAVYSRNGRIQQMCNPYLSGLCCVGMHSDGSLEKVVCEFPKIFCEVLSVLQRHHHRQLSNGA